ncbi:MAG: glycosyltransferase [Pirellulales bacterium]|nr:glycosyltransferase [Pirellulales bacterium]
MFIEKSIRVCFVIDNLSQAGTEMQLLLLLKHLDRERVQPYLCLLDGEEDSSRQLEPNDVPVIRLGVHSLISLFAIRQAHRLWRYLRQNKIDVVQTFFYDSTLFAAPLAKAAGVRAVFGSRRSIGHWMKGEDDSIAKMFNRLFIDKIIANCEAARQSIIVQEKVNPDNVVVIHNGIVLDRFEHILPWTPKPNVQSPVVGMVGNLREVKGPDIFIHAAKAVLDKHPGTQFEIAGGGKQKPYQKLIDDLGLSNNVRLLGSVSDIPAFLANLDVAVLPSRAEGLSNALLEYMAACRPIVATNVGGNSELIETDTNGLLTAADSPSELAAGILKLLASPRQAKKMAIEARKRVHQLYGIDSAALDHADFYHANLRTGSTQYSLAPKACLQDDSK